MKPSEPDPATCYATALRMLAGRDLSEFQLRQRLRRRGFPDAAIADAVARLTASGSLDDRRAAFASARTQLTVKRHGRARVLRELEAIGIAREVAREAVSEAFGDADESAMISRAIDTRHRAGGPIAPREFRRLHAYLLRQGFSPDAVVRALKSRAAGRFDEE